MSTRSRPTEDNRTVEVSKKLSKLLRHSAVKRNVPISSDGYITLPVILALTDFRDVNESEIEAIVRGNDKQRFTLITRNGVRHIRANQGHSFPVPDLELEELTQETLPGVVVHGTYYDAWESIQKTGLNRMGRTHIHFAIGLPGADGVISGMRKTAQVLIYLDAAQCITDGISLLRSANGVILSPGLSDGSIPVKYFTQVVDSASNRVLFTSAPPSASSTTPGLQSQHTNTSTSSASSSSSATSSRPPAQLSTKVISKKLSAFLRRETAASEDGGFVRLATILRSSDFADITTQLLEATLRDNKQRYETTIRDNEACIRLNPDFNR